MKGYSLEMVMRVYDDTNGCYYEVSPDADALDLVSMGYSDGDGPAAHVWAMPPAMARLVAAALVKVADSIEAKEPTDGR